MVCDYIYPRHNGRRCGKATCKLHTNALQTDLQRNASLFVGSNVVSGTGVGELLDCFVRSLESGINKLDICLAMTHIFDAQALKTLTVARGSKAVLADAIASLYMKLAKLDANKGFIRALKDLQRRWIRYTLMKHTTNATDPFTLIPINKIPINNLFVYRDAKGRVWAFSAKELSQYVTDTPINPYTRDSLVASDLDRLAAYAPSPSSSPSLSVSLDMCTTIDQMFTYAMGFYDDFYLQNWYFTNLSVRELSAIARPAIINSHREFAEFMINVARSPPEVRFGRMCLLVTRLAQYIDGLHSSLPEWVPTAASTATMQA